MPLRLVALDDGLDIMLDRCMVVVGRHPGCDARLESPRVSRYHCCVVPCKNEVLVRDLGSTNGIRINGQRVEIGRLKMDDEFSVAHVRYQLQGEREPDQPPAEPASSDRQDGGDDDPSTTTDDDIFAAAVRKVLPPSVAGRCRIQVIVQMVEDSARVEATPSPPPPSPPSTPHPVEEPLECPSS